jgi:glyoxylase-like metal-dependent hydrolase (beta-lactamase superfamily II)
VAGSVIHAERHGDVTRYVLTHWRSRVVRLSVSVYAVRGVLIDTGYPAAHEDLAGLLEGIRPRGVFITHYHEDHAGNAELVAGSGIPIAAPAATLEYLRRPKPIALYRRFTWGSMTPLRSSVTEFGPDDLALRAAPGHSHDHHVVWDETTGTLFGADLFLGVKVRVAHLNENPRELVRSLRAAAALGPDRLFDAHRGLVPRPAQALGAKAEWLEETIGRIDALADSGVSDAEIRRRVLPGRDAVDVVSRGDYTRLNFVRAVRRTQDGAPSVSSNTAPFDRHVGHRTPSP